MKRPTIKELQHQIQLLEDLVADKNNQLNAMGDENKLLNIDCAQWRERNDETRDRAAAAERQLRFTVESIDTIMGANIPEMGPHDTPDKKLLRQENPLFRVLDHIRFVASDGQRYGINYDSLK